MQRAEESAHALQRPVEEVLADLVVAALPDVEDAPTDMRAELVRMTWLHDRDLWTIAHSMMPEDQQRRLSELAIFQAERRRLDQEEQETLEALRQEYGRVTLRKARAFALLSLRSGRSLLTDE
jgi:hypothetical protein